MPGAIRVIVLDDARVLLDDLGACTAAGHGRAEEDVDDEHDEEHDAERDAQPEQPRRVDTVVAQLLDHWDRE